MKNLLVFENSTNRFKKHFIKLFLVLLLAISFNVSSACAQAPNISYTTPQVYNPFVPKTPLSPTNTGGTVPGTTAVTVGTLSIEIKGMAIDTSGDLYFVGYNSTSVTELKGGSFITLGSTYLHPTGVAVDAAGNLFIADNGNKNIKEIPAGSKTEVIYIAAITQPNGYPTLAPYGIAVDAADNIYVSTSNGVYKIAAGTKKPVLIGGGDDTGIAVDAGGDVYASDIGRQAVTEIPAGSGKTITLASNLPSLDGIAVDAGGNVYYSQDNTVIMELPVGGGAAFPVVTGLSDATSVAVDKKGNIFTESGGNTIEEAPFGIYSITRALPPGLTFDRKTGVIAGTPVAVTAAANYTVTGANSSGSSMATINIAVNNPAKPNISYSSPQTFYVGTAGSVSPTNAGGAVPAQQPVPLVTSSQTNYSLRGLAVDGAGNVYAGMLNADALLGADFIEKIPPGGGTPVAIGSGFSQPAAVAVDGTGNVFVADYGNKVVKEILASNGSTITYATGFTAPEGVAVDAAGNVYVCDNSKNAIFKIPAGGGTPVELIAGAGLNGPTGIAVDVAGNIYIANNKGNNIKELPAGGTTTILLASGFGTVYDLAVDAVGNVFVADEGNSVIKRIPTGGGTPVVIAQAVPVSQPSAIALDANSNIYVADGSSQYIYEINPGYFINPTLPAGLNINQSTGVISGTPTATKAATNYTVTAYNSGGIDSVVVKIKIVSGTNTSMSGLTINHGTLAPAYSPSTTSYAVSVSSAVGSVTFTPTTSDGTATVTVNGTPVASGVASPAILLSVGANIIHILVDDNSGTTEANYTVTVTRASSANANLSSFKISKGTLSPTFNSTTTSYTAAVVNGVTSMTVTPTTADPSSTVTVNGVAVSSGSASQSLPLTVGQNTITTVVSASDGETTKTYTLVVTEAASVNANLSSLKISKGALTPAFNTNTTSYTASVVNGVTSMTVTPTAAASTATITVNGTAVTSGTPSGAIALAVGSNTINTVVTAQDGTTTKTYTITVTRASGGADSFDPGISVSKPEETPTLADDGIAVHQAISPNGDGINDFLVIENINQYPDNKLTIMNRSGQLIYEASGYDNASKSFDGHSNKNGQMQLPGTYFYQLDYTVSGIIKHKTGFIVLKY